MTDRASGHAVMFRCVMAFRVETDPLRDWVGVRIRIG
jgi:hypothetical protein